MSVKADLLKRATSICAKIAFPEGEDPRVLDAARTLVGEGIAQPVLIAEKVHHPAMRARLAEQEPEVEILDPLEDLETYAELFLEKRRLRGKTLTKAQAREAAKDPLNRAALMVSSGVVEAAVGGAVRTTSETVRAAIQCIGAVNKTVSSFFQMIFPDQNRCFLYADCGIIPQPNASQLAEIAVASAKSWRQLMGTDPRVAFLSFSTKGSAKDASIEPILEALNIVKRDHSELLVDGELQVDAALVPEVATKKAPDSPLGGQANVLIFPNLHAGNIAYKLTQRLAGATALGPVLQGLQRPMNDLSRGCNAEDIVLVSAISAIQSQSKPLQ